jgi:hypothetical protein
MKLLNVPLDTFRINTYEQQVDTVDELESFFLFFVPPDCILKPLCA